MLPPPAPAGRGDAAVVTIGMNYAVLPGKERVFEDACEKVVEAMQGDE
jgi:hypothetical protein